jgi:ribokinase
MILNIGDLMVDVFEDRRHPGGKAALYAAAQARSGAHAAVIGALGNDPDGQTVRAALARLGIDSTGVVSVTEVTGWDEVDGDSWVIDRGANWAVSDEIVLSEAHRSLWADATTVLINQGVPAGGSQAAIEEARRRGALTILALAPEAVEPERRVATHYYSMADIVFVNRIEAEHLFEEAGLQIDGETDASIAAKLWEVVSPRQALVYCRGVRGADAVIGDPDGTLRTASAHGAEFFEAATEHYIGAGDAMVGLITAELDREHRNGRTIRDLGDALDTLLSRGVDLAADTTKWAGPLTYALQQPSPLGASGGQE